MKSTKVREFSRRFLPQANAGMCSDETSEQLCFQSGDKRTSQNMGLVSIHTVWMREHDRISKKLQKMHPDWDDESVYQVG